MKIIEKWWAVALVMIIVAVSQNAKACGGDDAVYPETVETPTVVFKL